LIFLEGTFNALDIKFLLLVSLLAPADKQPELADLYKSPVCALSIDLIDWRFLVSSPLMSSWLGFDYNVVL
jgi:hypothetical protein